MLFVVWVRYLVFVVLVVVVAAIVLAVQRGQGRLAARASAGAEPTTRHAAALKEARQRLRRAERVQAKRVREAQKALAKVSKDSTIAAVGSVTLTARSVSVRGTERALSPTTAFAVEVLGAVDTVLKDGKVTKVDQREVFLTVTDRAWADVVKLPGAQLEGARRLAAAGDAAVRNLEHAQEEFTQRIRSAQRELDRVRADTGAVDAARLTLEDLAGSPPRRIDPLDPPAQADPPPEPGS